MSAPRALASASAFRKVEFEPYVCEECQTDFTPNWKAIAGDKGDLHVYCEQCVRQAQKRKIKNERNGLYKKVFQKISEQEKVSRAFCRACISPFRSSSGR